MTDNLVRMGRPLRDWLLGLMAYEKLIRRRAACALAAMAAGQPSVETFSAFAFSTAASQAAWVHGRGRLAAQLLTFRDLDLPAHRERFRAAVRAAVDADGFPAETFVRRLHDHLLRDEPTWVRRQDRPRRELDELASACFSAPVPGDAGWEALDALLGPEGDLSQATSMAVWHVYGALGQVLLPDTDPLWFMLRTPEHQWVAAEALKRIGPPAATEFVAWLLDRLDEAGSFWGDLPGALAALACDDGDIVRGLVGRTGAAPRVAERALLALASMGPTVRTHVPEAVGVLLDASREPDVPEQPSTRRAALEAIATVGANEEEALERLLEALASQDEWEQAVAIDGLAHFTQHAHRVVPALVAATETFDEPDPDWGCGKDHQRIIHALQAFGPAAAPAVPKLLGSLRGEEGLNKAAFVLLAAIGPAAAEALPALQALADECAQEGPDWVDYWPGAAGLEDAIAAVRGGRGAAGQ